MSAQWKWACECCCYFLCHFSMIVPLPQFCTDGRRERDREMMESRNEQTLGDETWQWRLPTTTTATFHLHNTTLSLFQSSLTIYVLSHIQFFCFICSFCRFDLCSLSFWMFSPYILHFASRISGWRWKQTTNKPKCSSELFHLRANWKHMRMWILFDFRLLVF